MTFNLVLDRRAVAHPRLAVLMPCYNAGNYVPDCIEHLCSLRKEHPFDIIIVDDGSDTPVTDLISRSVEGIAVIRTDNNRGIVESLNAGLRFIIENEYEFVARQDVDDVSLPGRFTRQVRALLSDDRSLVCGTGFFIIDENGSVLAERIVSDNPRSVRCSLYFRNPFAHTSLMFRVQDMERLGLYNSEFQGAEDYDILIRAAKLEGLISIPQPLVQYRVHFSSISSKRLYQAATDMKVAMRHYDFTVLATAGLIKKAALLLCPRSIVNGLQIRFYGTSR